MLYLVKKISFSSEESNSTYVDDIKVLQTPDSNSGERSGGIELSFIGVSYLSRELMHFHFKVKKIKWITN